MPQNVTFAEDVIFGQEIEEEEGNNQEENEEEVYEDDLVDRQTRRAAEEPLEGDNSNTPPRKQPPIDAALSKGSKTTTTIRTDGKKRKGSSLLNRVRPKPNQKASAPKPAPPLKGTNQMNLQVQFEDREPLDDDRALINKPTPSLPHSSTLICPNCGSREIEQHDASGASVCTDCGVVVEENAIVSAVEFVEGAGGASNLVGQFVSATSSKAYTASSGGGGLRGGRYGFSRDSRETTLANGRRRIQEVASRLRLGSHYVDAAHRLFTIAVEKNFVQGRRTTHVVAACLYIACRQEKSQHMLIDFSDALQVNVYTLGTCFLKFRRLLGLKLEIIDPALYVYRFAAHLDLDAKANAVALTALRLVGRMKRDWIVAGRRPAGICAAALLIAARAHGFHKQHQDVTRILRVCGMTVTTRVKEFERTPSAQLTLDQFNTVELDSEADPPVFQRNKIREARAKAIQNGNVALLTSGVLDDPVRGKRAMHWRNPQKLNEKKVRFQRLYESLEQELAGKGPGMAERGAAKDLAEDEDNVVDDNKEQAESVSDSADAIQDLVAKGSTRQDALTTMDDLKGHDDHQIVEKTHDGGEPSHPGNEQLLKEGGTPTSLTPPSLRDAQGWGLAYPRTKYGRILVLPDHATAEERQESLAPVEAKLSLSDWKKEMPDFIDDEIEGLFRTEEEEKQKEAIFNKLNKDYLEKQERKENERLNSEAATKDQETDDVAQAKSRARYKSGRQRKRQRPDANAAAVPEPMEEGDELVDAEADDYGPDLPPTTTEEQLMAAVSSRRISRKINYDALSSIFDEDGSFSTEVDGNLADDHGMYSF